MTQSQSKGQFGSMDAEMASLGMKGINRTSMYQHSFGNLPNETRYVDAMKGIDTRKVFQKAAMLGYQRILQKAVGTTFGGDGTAGTSALVPVYVDSRLVDQSRKYTPLTEIIPRVTNQGLTADFNIITAKGAAFFAGQDAALTENDDTVDRRSENIKFLYSVGRVVGPMQAAVPAYILEGFQPSGAGNVGGNVFASAGAPTVLQQQVLLKARALKEAEEDAILNGNVSSDPLEFNGILQQQSTTNQNDIDGAALAWADIDETIELAYVAGGRPKVAVASAGAFTQLRKLMIDTFRWSPGDTTGNTLTFGVPSMMVIPTMVGPVTVIPSQFLANTANQKQIWFLDTDWIEMRVLMDMTFKKLADINDSEKFYLKEYLCLISRYPGANAFIDNIA